MAFGDIFSSLSSKLNNGSQEEDNNREDENDNDSSDANAGNKSKKKSKPESESELKTSQSTNNSANTSVSSGSGGGGRGPQTTDILAGLSSRGFDLSLIARMNNLMLNFREALDSIRGAHVINDFFATIKVTGGSEAFRTLTLFSVSDLTLIGSSRAVDNNGDYNKIQHQGRFNEQNDKLRSLNFLLQGEEGGNLSNNDLGNSEQTIIAGISNYVVPQALSSFQIVSIFKNGIYSGYLANLFSSGGSLTYAVDSNYTLPPGITITSNGTITVSVGANFADAIPIEVSDPSHPNIAPVLFYFPLIASNSKQVYGNFPIISGTNSSVLIGDGKASMYGNAPYVTATSTSTGVQTYISNTFQNLKETSVSPIAQSVTFGGNILIDNETSTPTLINVGSTNHFWINPQGDWMNNGSPMTYNFGGNVIQSISPQTTVYGTFKDMISFGYSTGNTPIDISNLTVNLGANVIFTASPTFGDIGLFLVNLNGPTSTSYRNNTLTMGNNKIYSILSQSGNIVGSIGSIVVEDQATTTPIHMPGIDHLNGPLSYKNNIIDFGNNTIILKNVTSGSDVFGSAMTLVTDLTGGNNPSSSTINATMSYSGNTMMLGNNTITILGTTPTTGMSIYGDFQNMDVTLARGLGGSTVTTSSTNLNPNAPSLSYFSNNEAYYTNNSLVLGDNTITAGSGPTNIYANFQSLGADPTVSGSLNSFWEYGGFYYGVTVTHLVPNQSVTIQDFSMIQRLFGGEVGQNTIQLGSNTLNAGAGQDTFHFTWFGDATNQKAISGFDTINHFSLSQDALNISIPQSLYDNLVAHLHGQGIANPTAAQILDSAVQKIEYSSSGTKVFFAGGYGSLTFSDLQFTSFSNIPNVTIHEIMHPDAPVSTPNATSIPFIFTPGLDTSQLSSMFVNGSQLTYQLSGFSNGITVFPTGDVLTPQNTLARLPFTVTAYFAPGITTTLTNMAYFGPSPIIKTVDNAGIMTGINGGNTLNALSSTTVNTMIGGIGHNLIVGPYQSTNALTVYGNAVSYTDSAIGSSTGPTIPASHTATFGGNLIDVNVGTIYGDAKNISISAQGDQALATLGANTYTFGGNQIYSKVATLYGDAQSMTLLAEGGSNTSNTSGEIRGELSANTFILGGNQIDSHGLTYGSLQNLNISVLGGNNISANNGDIRSFAWLHDNSMTINTNSINNSSTQFGDVFGSLDQWTIKVQGGSHLTVPVVNGYTLYGIGQFTNNTFSLAGNTLLLRGEIAGDIYGKINDMTVSVSGGDNVSFLGTGATSPQDAFAQWLGNEISFGNSQITLGNNTSTFNGSVYGDADTLTFSARGGNNFTTNGLTLTTLATTQNDQGQIIGNTIHFGSNTITVNGTQNHGNIYGNFNLMNITLTSGSNGALQLPTGASSPISSYILNDAVFTNNAFVLGNNTITAGAGTENIYANFASLGSDSLATNATQYGGFYYNVTGTTVSGQTQLTDFTTIQRAFGGDVGQNTLTLGNNTLNGNLTSNDNFYLNWFGNVSNPSTPILYAGHDSITNYHIGDHIIIKIPQYIYGQIENNLSSLIQKSNVTGGVRFTFTNGLGSLTVTGADAAALTLNSLSFTPIPQAPAPTLAATVSTTLVTQDGITIGAFNTSGNVFIAQQGLTTGAFHNLFSYSGNPLGSASLTYRVVSGSGDTGQTTLYQTGDFLTTANDALKRYTFSVNSSFAPMDTGNDTQTAVNVFVAPNAQSQWITTDTGGIMTGLAGQINTLNAIGNPNVMTIIGKGNMTNFIIAPYESSHLINIYGNDQTYHPLDGATFGSNTIVGNNSNVNIYGTFQNFETSSQSYTYYTQTYNFGHNNQGNTIYNSQGTVFGSVQNLTIKSVFGFFGSNTFNFAPNTIISTATAPLAVGVHEPSYTGSMGNLSITLPNGLSSNIFSNNRIIFGSNTIITGNTATDVYPNFQSLGADSRISTNAQNIEYGGFYYGVKVLPSAIGTLTIQDFSTTTNAFGAQITDNRITFNTTNVILGQGNPGGNTIHLTILGDINNKPVMEGFTHITNFNLTSDILNLTLPQKLYDALGGTQSSVLQSLINQSLVNITAKGTEIIMPNNAGSITFEGVSLANGLGNLSHIIISKIDQADAPTLTNLLEHPVIWVTGSNGNLSDFFNNQNNLTYLSGNNVIGPQIANDFLFNKHGMSVISSVTAFFAPGISTTLSGARYYSALSTDKVYTSLDVNHNIDGNASGQNSSFIVYLKPDVQSVLGGSASGSTTNFIDAPYAQTIYGNGLSSSLLDFASSTIYGNQTVYGNYQTYTLNSSLPPFIGGGNTISADTLGGTITNFSPAYYGSAETINITASPTTQQMHSNTLSGVGLSGNGAIYYGSAKTVNITANTAYRVIFEGNIIQSGSGDSTLYGNIGQLNILVNTNGNTPNSMFFGFATQASDSNKLTGGIGNDQFYGNVSSFGSLSNQSNIYNDFYTGVKSTTSNGNVFIGDSHFNQISFANVTMTGGGGYDVFNFTLVGATSVDGVNQATQVPVFQGNQTITDFNPTQNTLVFQLTNSLQAALDPNSTGIVSVSTLSAETTTSHSASNTIFNFKGGGSLTVSGNYTSLLDMATTNPLSVLISNTNQIALVPAGNLTSNLINAQFIDGNPSNTLSVNYNNVSNPAGVTFACAYNPTKDQIIMHLTANQVTSMDTDHSGFVTLSELDAATTTTTPITGYTQFNFTGGGSLLVEGSFAHFQDIINANTTNNIPFMIQSNGYSVFTSHGTQIALVPSGNLTSNLINAQFIDGTPSNTLSVSYNNVSNPAGVTFACAYNPTKDQIIMHLTANQVTSMDTDHSGFVTFSELDAATTTTTPITGYTQFNFTGGGSLLVEGSFAHFQDIINANTTNNIPVMIQSNGYSVFTSHGTQIALVPAGNLTSNLINAQFIDGIPSNTLSVSYNNVSNPAGVTFACAYNPTKDQIIMHLTANQVTSMDTDHSGFVTFSELDAATTTTTPITGYTQFNFTGGGSLLVEGSFAHFQDIINANTTNNIPVMIQSNGYSVFTSHGTQIALVPAGNLTSNLINAQFIDGIPSNTLSVSYNNTSNSAGVTFAYAYNPTKDQIIMHLTANQVTSMDVDHSGFVSFAELDAATTATNPIAGYTQFNFTGGGSLLVEGSFAHFQDIINANTTNNIPVMIQSNGYSVFTSHGTQIALVPAGNLTSNLINAQFIDGTPSNTLSVSYNNISNPAGVTFACAYNPTKDQIIMHLTANQVTSMDVDHSDFVSFSELDAATTATNPITGYTQFNFTGGGSLLVEGSFAHFQDIINANTTSNIPVILQSNGYTVIEGSIHQSNTLVASAAGTILIGSNDSLINPNSFSFYGNHLTNIVGNSSANITYGNSIVETITDPYFNKTINYGSNIIDASGTIYGNMKNYTISLLNNPIQEYSFNTNEFLGNTITGNGTIYGNFDSFVFQDYTVYADKWNFSGNSLSNSNTHISFTPERNVSVYGNFNLFELDLSTSPGIPSTSPSELNILGNHLNFNSAGSSTYYGIGDTIHLNNVGSNGALSGHFNFGANTIEINGNESGNTYYGNLESLYLTNTIQESNFNFAYNNGTTTITTGAGTGTGTGAEDFYGNVKSFGDSFASPSASIYNGFYTGVSATTDANGYVSIATTDGNNNTLTFGNVNMTGGLGDKATFHFTLVGATSVDGTSQANQALVFEGNQTILDWNSSTDTLDFNLTAALNNALGGTNGSTAATSTPVALSVLDNQLSSVAHPNADTAVFHFIGGGSLTLASTTSMTNISTLTQLQNQGAHITLNVV